MRPVDRKLIGRLQALVWDGPDTRRVLESHGISLVPCNFYSQVPSLDDITKSYEYTESAPPYLGSSIFSEAGTAGAERLLGELPAYTERWAPPRTGDEQDPAGFFLENSQFSWSDCFAYYAMVAHFRPRTLVEVGAGFSTLVAVEAMRDFEIDCDVTVIEPFPRPFLERLDGVRLVRRPVQEISPGELGALLSDGSMLFIDSTHTVKTGSDCAHLYLRLLPKLGRDLVVHAHDVFLPHGLPASWLTNLHIYWVEQYLLLALLTDNPRAEFLFGSSFHKEFHADGLDALNHGRYPTGGSSFWFRYAAELPVPGPQGQPPAGSAAEAPWTT